jgi:hypothetical protein
MLIITQSTPVSVKNCLVDIFFKAYRINEFIKTAITPPANTMTGLNNSSAIKSSPLFKSLLARDITDDNTNNITPPSKNIENTMGDVLMGLIIII